jgi:hypothetical protein
MSSDTGETDTANLKEIEAVAREEAAMKIPAFYTDAFRLSLWRGHVRLSFGEGSPKAGTHWRVAVVVEQDEVKELILRLQAALRELEKLAIPEPAQEKN